MKLVIISTYTFSHEAHIAKASLESEGIAAFIGDENTVQLNWLYANMLGGVKLLVAKGDVEQAQRILMTDYSENVQQEFEMTEAEAEEESIPIRCTACGSLDVKPFTKGKKSAFVMIMLLGFPHFFYQQGFKCAACGHFFKDEPVSKA